MPSNSISVIVPHYVFLTREQRYALNEKPTTKIEVVGWCTPVWCKGIPFGKKKKWINSEPVKEIICRYVVTNQLGKVVIEVEKDGFRLNLATKNVCGKLLDVKDMGCKSVNFANRAQIHIAGDKYPVIHFVNINDIGLSKQSLTV